MKPTNEQLLRDALSEIFRKSMESSIAHIARAALAATVPDTEQSAPFRHFEVQPDGTTHDVDPVDMGGTDTQYVKPFIWIDASPDSTDREDRPLYENITQVVLTGASEKFGRSTTPLYTHPAPSQSADQVRDVALEEAAREVWSDKVGAGVLRGAAHAIRALKSATAAPESAEPSEDQMMQLLALNQQFKAQGWRDMFECPHDTEVEFIEFGSTGIHKGVRLECGDVFLAPDGEFSMPIMWRRLATSSAAKGDADV